MSAPPDLPATGYAILGMLCFERELTGYDAKKWSDASLGHFYWSPATSHVYRELARLEALGLVAAREATPDEPRTKRIYRITPAGRDAVAAWVTRPTADAVVLKHPAALRVWLGHLVAREQVREIVERHIEQVETRLATIDESLEGAQAIPTDGLPSMELPCAVLRWSRAIHRADLDGARDLLRELGGGTGAAVTSDPTGAASRRRAPPSAG